jgi:hypothetical protein
MAVGLIYTICIAVSILKPLWLVLMCGIVVHYHCQIQRSFTSVKRLYPSVIISDFRVKGCERRYGTFALSLSYSHRD